MCVCVCVCVCWRLDHYSHMSDVQTLAMLCSVFRAQAPPPDCYSLYGHHASRSAMFPPHHSRYVSLHWLQLFSLDIWERHIIGLSVLLNRVNRPQCLKKLWRERCLLMSWWLFVCWSFYISRHEFIFVFVSLPLNSPAHLPGVRQLHHFNFVKTFFELFYL